MADENKFKSPEQDRFSNPDYRGITPLDQEIERDYNTESAAEIAAPVYVNRNNTKSDYKSEDVNQDGQTAGRGMGFLALAMSIISLFFLPVLLGAAGIIVGFIARRKGAKTIGAWAIGIGIVSLVLGIFITPFF